MLFKRTFPIGGSGPVHVGRTQQASNVVGSINFRHLSFSPLKYKTWGGAVVVQRYSPPATPCYRLFNCETVSVEPKEQLCEHRPRLDPVALLDASR